MLFQKNGGQHIKVPLNRKDRTTEYGKYKTIWLSPSDLQTVLLYFRKQIKATDKIGISRKSAGFRPER